MGCRHPFPAGQNHSSFQHVTGVYNPPCRELEVRLSNRTPHTHCAPHPALCNKLLSHLEKKSEIRVILSLPFDLRSRGRGSSLYPALKMLRVTRASTQHLPRDYTGTMTSPVNPQPFRAFRFSI
ncbi:group XIIA secretory phospholipase A2 [Platysternon megacephalum]|uniref:Group XIIA secretory phospholipase A2 n=1 Tax=Platysternon megacephalum TaxID=55544 RepID=A0A4D9DZC6_9SAUR|nr:group XIIA secretory phospholipase A2 [Platysternon megacephalum]